MKKTYHIPPQKSPIVKINSIIAIVFLLLGILFSASLPNLLFWPMLCISLVLSGSFIMESLLASFCIILEEDKLTVSNYFIPRWGSYYPLREVKHVLFWFGPGILAKPYFRVHLQNGKRSSFRSLSALIPKERIYELIYDLRERGIAAEFSHARFYPKEESSNRPPK